MKIHAATFDNVPSMMSLESACVTAAHWTKEQYQGLFTDGNVPPRLTLVVENEGEAPDSTLLGFLVARHLAPEWELENIVVALAARRTGVGKQLLEALLTAARETQSEGVFLEVRESNVAARGLYEKLGFVQTARRKSYYTNPLEDAILYSFTLV